MRGSIRPFPQYTSMVWYSVKEKAQWSHEKDTEFQLLQPKDAASCTTAEVLVG